MEKNSGFSVHQDLPLNLSRFCFETGHSGTGPIYPHSIVDSTFEAFPSSQGPRLEKLKASEPNIPRNWFHCMPRFHHAVCNASNSVAKDKFPTVSLLCGQHSNPTAAPIPVHKKFLVFDQSGDRTSLIYSSELQPAVQFGAFWKPIHSASYNLFKEEALDCKYPSNQSPGCETLGDNSRNNVEDEVHEDTEELNALLFSDSDCDFSVEDEETSTGHSPSTMTNNCVRDPVDETGEEVNSFSEHPKRQKLVNGSYKLPSKGKISGLHASADDAESSCGSDKKQLEEELGSFSCNGRSRKEKIRETVAILQSLIPSADGNEDAVLVIDQAICYLSSLKAQVKSSGIHTL